MTFYMIIILAIACGISIILSYKGLEVTYYQLQSDKIHSHVRIAVLADLHNRQFGSDNERLIKKVEKQNPDLLLLAGDIIDEDAEDEQLVFELIRELSQIAPVYYALGNHELAYEEKHPGFLGKVKDSEATLLEESYEDIQADGNSIRVGSMYGYAFTIEGEEDGSPGIEFMKEFADTDSFQIMMYHRPESYVLGNAAELWKVDMAVSGHIHGGQMILPFSGGIYGAELGWFPDYTYGKYQLGETACFLTRGLGSGTEPLPRFNNIPEIMVIDLEPEIAN